MSAPKTTHPILFVDDEPDFLQMVAEKFGELSGGTWQIHRATSAAAALDLLKREKVDLAVVDNNMPLLDGLQFLKILHRRYPDLKKVTLTALATEEKRSECLANGAELFIEKPQSSDGFKSIYVMLEELLSWTPKTGFQGVLRQVGLQDVLQMECLGRNSSILEVHNPQVRGRIYIENGSIIHALLGEDAGEKAFQKLLCLPSGEFELLPFEAPETRTLEGPWEFLLMEASRVRDEAAAQAPAAAAALAEKIAAEAEPEETIPPTAAVRETLICSAQGEPLYQWQCADAVARIALLQNISQQAELLGRTLPVGAFERLEIRQAQDRTLAQISGDRMVFVRVAHVPSTA